MKRSTFGLSLVLGLLAFAHGRTEDRYKVHEWGTFTVLQDEQGRPLPGVNVNEESLPPFVHRLYRGLAPQEHELSPLGYRYSKGLPASYSAALMRMETPIIYIYPPASPNPPRLDVSVRFRGGWISEWYPNAEVVSPGFQRQSKTLGALTPQTTGSIHWKGLRANAAGPPPKTDEPVWLAPRNVAAAQLATEKNEREKYLFYRGVANIEAPLQVLRTSDRELQVRFNRSARNLQQDRMTFNALWLADIRRDGSLAFRELPSMDSENVLKTAATFAEADYRKSNMAALRASMREVLQTEGLREDEADAMLNTWRVSYFQSPGLRLFFTLPRTWTDAVLPLEFSQPADMERVMIGRIEIVTPEHRSILKKLMACQVSPSTWLWKEVNQLPPQQRSEFWREVVRGRKRLSDYDLKIPEDYQAFLRLGRFRDALVMDQLRREPTENLKQFVQVYRLQFQDHLQAKE